jgi:hypothetical protein
MTDESKILWASPNTIEFVQNHHLVGTHLSRRFIEGEYTIPLYTTPQQRTWVGLTSEDYNGIFEKARTGEHAVQLAEAKLRGNNT